VIGVWVCQGSTSPGSIPMYVMWNSFEPGAGPRTVGGFGSVSAGSPGMDADMLEGSHVDPVRFLWRQVLVVDVSG
jgi:hypothetical protein